MECLNGLGVGERWASLAQGFPSQIIQLPLDIEKTYDENGLD